MAKQLFKGIKSVLGTSFAEVSAEERKGYIWFVRTIADSNAEEDGVQDDGNLANDEYDIYFGTKHYAHYQEGQFEALETKISEVAGDASAVATALEKVAALINAGEDYNSIAVMGESYDTLADAFAKVTERLDAAESAISGLQASLQTYVVKNVAEGDKILNVADGILSSKLTIDYDGGLVRLKGINDEVISSFNASEFVKDSVLQDVAVVTDETDGKKYIEFTWNVIDGEETKTDRIAVEELASEYSAGTAIDIADDNSINVKVAAENNFLEVKDGALIVDDMTVDKTILKEDITIEGGPLASDAVKAAFEDGVIPAGTDIQAVLKALLCVEIYPVPVANTPSYSASIAAPSITASVSNGALVEVGQTVKINAVAAKEVSISKTQPKVATFNHGYSDTIDGTINSATSVSAAWTISQMENNVYKLSAASTGFTGTLPTTVQNAAAASCSLAAVDLVAVEGTNKYAVTEDAPKHTGSHPGIEAKYIVSNLGGRSEDKKSPVIAPQSDVEKDPSNQTATFTVTGVYPWYTNGVSASTTDATAAAMADLAAPVEAGTKLALMKAGATFAVSFANQGLAPYRLYLPGSLKISSALAINPTTAKFAIDCKANFVANGTTTFTVQGKEITYAIYEWASTEGPNRVKFTVA